MPQHTTANKPFPSFFNILRKVLYSKSPTLYIEHGPSISRQIYKRNHIRRYIIYHYFYSNQIFIKIMAEMQLFVLFYKEYELITTIDYTLLGIYKRNNCGIQSTFQKIELKSFIPLIYASLNVNQPFHFCQSDQAVINHNSFSYT